MSHDNPEEQAQLQEILAQGSALKTIYDFRNELQEVWHRTTANQLEMLERLQNWCQQAEATGFGFIHASQDFATPWLKTYNKLHEPFV